MQVHESIPLSAPMPHVQTSNVEDIALAGLRLTPEKEQRSNCNRVVRKKKVVFVDVKENVEENRFALIIISIRI